MAFGVEIVAIVAPFFTPIHVITFLVGLYGTYWASKNGQKLWMVAFGAWTVTELVYLSYHSMQTVTAEFAHVFQEVVLLLAFVYVIYSARK